MTIQPTLVLLHGVGHSRAAWDLITPLLDAQFNVIALDSPGFGGESLDRLAEGQFTIPAYTDAFELWLNELGLTSDNVVVAGNSMGGAIALELARRGRVRSACAISPAGFWTRQDLLRVKIILGSLAYLPHFFIPILTRAVKSKRLRSLLMGALVAYPRNVSPTAAAGAIRDLIQAPATKPVLRSFNTYTFQADPHLGAAGTPAVTVAWGTKDRLLPYARQALRAQHALPGAKHISLPGLGHVPMTDDPTTVAALIMDALTPRAENE